MIKTLFVLLFTFSVNIGFGQLSKGKWLVSGSGSFQSSSRSYSSPTLNMTSDRIEVRFSSGIGYFIIDKLAAGLRPSYTKTKDQQTNQPVTGYSNENRFEIGPFVRYYFLDKTRQFNLLSDVSYQYGIYRFKPSKGNINTFSASAGPVIFFNSGIGLEFLIGYYKRNEIIDEVFKNEEQGLQMILGFQLSLGK